MDTPIEQNHRLCEAGRRSPRWRKKKKSCSPPKDPPVDKGSYQRLVGKLIYLAHTRPDIAYAASMLARFNSNSGVAHWNAVKHLLCYLKGTINLRLEYGLIQPLVTSCLLLILMLHMVITKTMESLQVGCW